MKPILYKLFPAHEGATPYIYVSNIAIPLYFMLQEPPLRLIPGLLLLALLLALYRQSYWSARRAGWIIGIQLGITFLLAYAYHPMYIYIVFIFLLPLIRLPLRLMYVFSGSFAAGTLVILYESGSLLKFELILVLLPPLFGGTILPFIVKASMKYKEVSEKLKQAMGQIERMAQEQERQRIARELHDTLGHTLSLISLKSELVQRLAHRDPSQAAQEAYDIQETSRTALQQMRSLVSGMNTVKLAEEIAHARTLCAAAGVEFDWKPGGLKFPLTGLQETIAAMSLRELIMNVVRHSKADACSVSIEQDRKATKLIVTDNGIGLRPDTLAKKSGNGIIGIRERLQLIDGKLHVETSQDNGAAFMMEIPFVIKHGHEGDVS